MTSIRKYARATNTPVLCTIHQPSELLFELGDALLLLSGGKQVYFGPLSGLEPHFNALGFECPERTSISEWLLDLVNRDFGENAVVDKCVNEWADSPAKRNLDASLQRLDVPADAPPPKVCSCMHVFLVSHLFAGDIPEPTTVPHRPSDRHVGAV